MLFSGKITNSFLNFLSRKGADLEGLWEQTDLPLESLKDPSSWIDSAEVEKLVAYMDRQYSHLFSQGSLVTSVGHMGSELRAWGVLDSVLKMMQKPQEIFNQPQRFLSYFISPAPPIANLTRDFESVSFDIPISNQEYPFVTEYLRSALEALPKYQSYSAAMVKWNQTRVSISWSDGQANFLGDEDLQRNVRPELVENLVHSLEEAQTALEKEKRKCLEKDLQILKLETLLSEQQTEGSKEAILSSVDIEEVEGQLLKMRDYFFRASQLVTLLIGQNRLDSQVKEAMRRVDWERIGHQFPGVFSQALSALRKWKKIGNTPGSPGATKLPAQVELSQDNLQLPMQ